MNSIFPSFLYYFSFIIIASKIFHKEIFLVSQTLGPFSLFDRILSWIIFNIPDRIAFREKISKTQGFFRYGIAFPEVSGCLDAAYSLSEQSSYQLPKHSKKTVRLGLSVHPWINKYQNDFLSKMMIRNIETISKSYRIEVILIPHIIDNTNERYDMEFMKTIMKPISGISLIIPSYDQIAKSSDWPAYSIKHLTSQVDILITSRYHGAIFGLSSDVPTISISYDRYYEEKFRGAYRFIYGIDDYRYMIKLENKQASSDMSKKIKSLLSNYENEKQLLEKYNDSLPSKPESRYPV